MSPPIVKPAEILSADPSNAFTRRDFIKSSALAAGAALVPTSHLYADFPDVNSATTERLTTGWEYFQGSLGGVWDVWRTDMTDSIVWRRVQVPHCFNARDAVDPDQPAYEGPRLVPPPQVASQESI